MNSSQNVDTYESMHPTPLQPAYLVVLNTPDQAPIETRFPNTDLLTARKAAMTYAEALFYDLDESDHSTQIEVYLIEQSRVESTYTPVARVLRGTKSASPETDPLTERIRCLDNLTELYQENAYYQQYQYPIGFGIFHVSVDHADKLVSEGNVLWDAAPTVQAAVSRFNALDLSPMESNPSHL